MSSSSGEDKGEVQRNPEEASPTPGMWTLGSNTMALSDYCLWATGSRKAELPLVDTIMV